MKDADNRHSQIIGWVKIALPLCALGLLSTLFLFARGSHEPSQFALTRIDAAVQNQRISAPRLSGVTNNGAIILISAQSASPDDTRLDFVNIDEMHLRMDNPDGSHLNITATSGEVDGQARAIRFLGLAQLETSTGYAMETNDLAAELDTGLISSNSRLEIRAPFGNLTAGGVEFQMGNADFGDHMLFTNGVRLLYMPKIP